MSEQEPSDAELLMDAWAAMHELERSYWSHANEEDSPWAPDQACQLRKLAEVRDDRASVALRAWALVIRRALEVIE